jgi:glycosyltransferase involved in cell wall biosynthesis
MNPAETASTTSPARRRRILVCSPFPPRLDARHGGKATAQLLLQLAERNDVALLCLQEPGADSVDPAIAARCARIDEIPLRADGALARRVRWTWGLVRGLPPWAADCRSDEFSARLERLLEEWRPDVVEIHLQAMAQYVEPLRNRDVGKILLDYDPASAWAEEMARTASGLRRVARWIEVLAWRRHERATRPRFDAIVVFAERDLADVGPTAGDARLLRIPLAVDVPAEPLDALGTEPPTILFFGSFGHHPNVDASLWLARDIFPRVLERAPHARLELVGQEPPDEIRALETEAIAVHGSVPDMTPFIDRAAVVVAPIRLGGSMRMKVLETLAAGKALVATPRAAEGVEATAGEHYLLTEDEDSIVEALTRLVEDPEARRALGRSARVWAEANLGWGRGVRAFEQLYDELGAK